MCSKKMIVCNCDGYVLKHSTCGRIEVGFGTSAYTLTKDEYVHFVAQLEQAASDYYSHASKPKTKSIYLHLFSQHVALVLTYTELSKLIELTQEADFQLKLYNLIGFESYGKPEMN